MHKLHRGNAPECLDKYHHGLHNWRLTPEDITEIWQGLEAMQGKRCAYCEVDISNGKRHIEHFRQRSRDPAKTFDWRNLFGSCNRKTSCGKHKDGLPPYNPDDLIKPDEEDPEYFFLLVSDGTIAIRELLSANDKRRAEATLRIFNLDAQHGPLRRMRQKAVQGYIQQAEELQNLSFEDPELLPQVLDEINRLIADTAHLPFATAIKHTLSL
jgi:uncharacterized protein (TIGR02646 family)